MLSNDLIERNSIILRNLINSPVCDTRDVWTSGSNYDVFSITYEKPLIVGHYYYCRYQYKFETTNQMLAWAGFYFEGGSGGRIATIDNPVPSTEYTASHIARAYVNSRTSLSAATFFHGPSNSISGCTSYVKNFLFYDVTELYYLLLANSIISKDNTTELKTWCDTNLDWSPRLTEYDATDLVYSNIDNKVCMKDGMVIANNFIERDGMQFYSINNNIRNNTYFDTAVGGTYVYNNKGNGNVVFTRIDAKTQNSPFYPQHKYILQITTNGEASPGAGGFYTNHVAAANKIFIEKFVAKVPVGYTVNMAYNSQGTGSSVTWITSNKGTGEWEEYGILYKCGASGSFSTGGHVYLTGSNNQSVTWYLGYVNDCDITGNEYLKYYAALPKKHTFKNANVYDEEFDTMNLLSNGRCTKLEPSMLANKWSYDTEDIAGNGYASLVQPVGGGAASYGDFMAIDSTKRYKVSYWVKCKGDMTNFLTAIYYYTDAKSLVLSHIQTMFVNGTETTLTQPLNSGDTIMYVADNSKWVVTNYSRIGFRGTDKYFLPSYNKDGTSNGPSGSTSIVASTSGTNIVNLNVPYSGVTRPVGTVVVESYDGGNYPYPIQKGNLPTDNTWKYVEGYFGGNDVIFNGNGSAWAGIPFDTKYIKLALNIYSNNGTVPIKYCDIRIEQVTSGGYCRKENKIQFNVKEA